MPCHVVWSRPFFLSALLGQLLSGFTCRAEGGGMVALVEPPGAGAVPADVSGEVEVPTEPDEPPMAGDAMTQLLNWGIKHSDPEKLKELMRKYQEHNLTLKDVHGQDVLDALFVDEGSEMKALVGQIAEFRDPRVEDEGLELALDRLQEFIEQIDNAGNLHRMGGLVPLLELSLCEERSWSTRTLALWTLGVAVQNNPPVQDELLSVDGLQRLASQLPRCSSSGQTEGMDQFCGKLLFTVSALVKNSDAIQVAAGDMGIFDWLLQEGTRHTALSVAKKSMGLLDTVLAQSPELPILKDAATEAGGGTQWLAVALLRHVRGETVATESDTDAAEKALRLTTRLLSLRPVLFPRNFQQELTAAVAQGVGRCERSFGISDELCEGLTTLAKNAELMLTARSVSDDEL